MEKRSKGVTILGWFNIILSFYIYFYAKNLLIHEHFLQQLERLQSININHTPLSYMTINIVGVIFCIIEFIAGILILKLKEVGRKLEIYFSIAVLFFTIFVLAYLSIQKSNQIFILFVSALSVLLPGIYIYFFTRPKVKEQFK